MLRVKNGYMLDKVFACVLVVIALSLLMNGLVKLLAYWSMPHERRRESTPDLQHTGKHKKIPP